MTVFRVSSRNAQMAIPQGRPRYLPAQWDPLAHSIGGLLSKFAIGALIIAPLMLFRTSDTVFLLLPGIISLIGAQPFRYQLGKFLRGTLLYLLITIGFTLLYYAALSEWQILIHQPSNEPHIILVTTAIAGVVILDPLRLSIQTMVERHFNIRNREAAKAIEAFTATLRDEIDIHQLCDRLFTLVQQTIEPYSVTLWINSAQQTQQLTDFTEETKILADDDALIACALRYPGVLEVERLHIESPTLEELRRQKAEILLPLANQGELIGLLILGPRLKGEMYSHEERQLLERLAPQIAPALRVAQLVYAQQLQVRERERIEQELRTAQAIQRAFLPKHLPAVPGWSLTPYYQPAREVGGDFYDVLALSDGRWGLVIGDVTGKGVPAALVMATVHTMLRTTVQSQRTPGAILSSVNDLLIPDMPPGMFITCFFAILDPQSGHICYANAGHELPYHYKNGEICELWATGMPLGLLPGIRYEEYQATLAPGEHLFLYSDGLVEARNAEREMLGFPRLSALLSMQQDSADLIDFLLKELADFTGNGWQQEDDVTMLVVHRSLEKCSPVSVD